MARAVGPIVALIGATLPWLAGCESTQQMLDQSQALAEQTAVERGRFELNCPEAQPTVISRELVQPALVGPFVQAIPRAEYTIGVDGCGQRKVFVVICPEGGGHSIENRLLLTVATSKSDSAAQA